jgi:hypothetical protein
MTSDQRGTPPNGAAAGSLLLAAMVACGLIGLGVGALIGAAALLTTVGVCVGVLVGIAVVRSLYRDL